MQRQNLYYNCTEVMQSIERQPAQTIENQKQGMDMGGTVKNWGQGQNRVKNRGRTGTLAKAETGTKVL